MMLCKPYILLFCSVIVVIVGATVFAQSGAEPQRHDAQTAISVIPALVVPHHDLLTSNFQSYYDSFSDIDREKITSVILLAPNHHNPHAQKIVTTDQSLPFVIAQQMPTAITDVQDLLGKEMVLDHSVFAEEHAVFLHLPLIAKFFPQAKVTPFLLTRNVPQSALDRLIQTVNSSIDSERTVVIVSSDFSHGLAFSEAQKKDDETLAAIESNNAEALLHLGDEYLDCPACLYVLLGFENKNGQMQSPDVIFHGNAAQFMQLQPEAPTTSYFVLRW